MEGTTVVQKNAQLSLFLLPTPSEPPQAMRVTEKPPQWGVTDANPLLVTGNLVPSPHYNQGVQRMFVYPCPAANGVRKISDTDQ